MGRGWRCAVRFPLNFGAILIPVHYVSFQHWGVICVHTAAQAITLYDSMSQRASHRPRMERVLSVAQAWAQGVHVQHGGGPAPQWSTRISTKMP